MEESGIDKSINGVMTTVIVGRKKGCFAFFASLIVVKFLSRRMDRKTELKSVLETIMVYDSSNDPLG